MKYRSTVFKYVEHVVWPSKMIQQCATMAALGVIVFQENYNKVRDQSYSSLNIANVENKIKNQNPDLRRIDFTELAPLDAQNAEPF